MILYVSSNWHLFRHAGMPDKFSTHVARGLPCCVISYQLSFSARHQEDARKEDVKCLTKETTQASINVLAMQHAQLFAEVFVLHSSQRVATCRFHSDSKSHKSSCLATVTDYWSMSIGESHVGDVVESFGRSAYS